MKNNILERDLKEILANPSNYKDITKGDLSGASISLISIEPLALMSYVYYSKTSDRNKDYNLLISLTKK